MNSIDYILLGYKGFLGQETEKILLKQNKKYLNLNTRLGDYENIEKNIKLYKPKYIICAAGISGKPTIEWCENNKRETYNVNVVYVLNLCDLCKKYDIHLTIYGSGSIYNSVYNDKYYKEQETCNNYSKFYIRCRILLEELIKDYDNVLYLRIQYPVSLTNNSKCFINKILTRVNNIHDHQVCITFIPTLFKYIPYLIEKNITGILNYVNKGSINLSNLLDLYNLKNKKNVKYNKISTNLTCGLLDTSLLNDLINNELNTFQNDYLNNE